MCRESVQACEQALCLGKNSEERPVHRLVQAIPSLIFTEGSGRGGGGAVHRLGLSLLFKLFER